MKGISTLPEKFLERLQKQYPNHFEKILTTFHQRPPVIRVQHLLTEDAPLLAELKKEGIEAQAIPSVPHAYQILHADRKTLTSLEAYEQGLFYIQSAASQVPVQVLDPQPGEKVLDLCAAPGSKTTQIAIHMKGRGELMANEPNKDRFFKLLANLQHQKVDAFVTAKKHPGQNYPAFYPEYFDRVLVDVPCSSESRFIEGDQKTSRYWSQPKVKSLSKLQRALLSAAIQCAKPGGTIVYSTCSLSFEENEQVLQKLLKKYPEVHLEQIQGDLKTLPVDPSVSGAIRLMPDEVFESFFVASLKKTKTVSRTAQGKALGNHKKQKYTL
ncbi:MAG: RsmB/NOP family class I SAM-dependent RNA methyltransferase [Candidatus Altimarinota bacterium]